jgi:toxin-antitoxin system PIN domain toxin
VIAVDTNLLVFAHRRDSRWHVPAAQTLASLANGREAWAIPWPCLHEFYSIATHPRIYAPASSPAQALAQLRAWRESPSLTLLAEDDAYWQVLESLVERSRVTGPAIHDARIAALCLRHGVHELLTADRDFSRFPEFVARNPLPGSRR